MVLPYRNPNKGFIKSTMSSDNTWVNFFSQFSQTQGDFIQTLTVTFPDLSSSQFRVCSYLKAGYNTREIAEEMSLSVRSIESHRYRLRRKLGVGKSENLAMYIHTLH